MLDIEEPTVKAVDKADMLGRVLAYPELLQRSIENTQDLSFALPRTPTRILVVGMGGSAISADYLAAWLNAEGSLPLLVSREYELPAWVDRDTLVLGFSYSGNTEETLASFAAARKKGAMLGAMSTGNRLEELARKYDAPFVRVESGMQPRAALPSAFGTAAMLLDRLGLLNAQKALEDSVGTLREAVVDLTPDASVSRNEAKRTALALQDSVACIYAGGILAPTAIRFANQLNENSKVIAHSGIMPEMNHNELVAWAGDDDLDRFTALFLRHNGEHPQDKQRYDFTADLIQRRGGRVIQHEARGANTPQRLLTATLVGDATSVYLAIQRKTDPTPVDIIVDLKRRMSETGFAATIE